MANKDKKQQGGQHTPFAPAPVTPAPSGGNKNVIIAFSIGLLIGIGATWLGFTVGDSSTTPTDNTPTDQTPSGDGTTTNGNGSDSDATTNGADTNSLVVTEQRPGTVVDVERVSLAEPGWVVIHEMRDGELGNALGAGWFDAGSEQFGRVNLLRGLEAEAEYYAVLYDDVGDDRLFDLDEDTPLQDSNGNRIQSTFTAVPPPAAAGN